MPKTSLDTTKVSFLTISEDNHDQRVDNFLLSQLKGVPKTLVYRVIRKGEVRVNKKRVKADTRLKSGDLVRIPPVRLPERGETPPVSTVLRDKLDSAILYEDDGLLAVNKPCGLAVHGGSGVSLGMIEALRKMRPDHSFLELVHRLDRDTSGVILVAKKRSVLKALQTMLAHKQGITKEYLAMVHGRWPQLKMEVNQPLLRVERQSGERMVRVSADGKQSLTRFELLAQGGRYALVKAEPVTGRTHQIRVHSQSVGCVIAGDEKYRSPIDVGIDDKQGIKRLHLHAWRLQFRHPTTGERLCLIAEPDQELQRSFQQAGCQWSELVENRAGRNADSNKGKS